MGFSGFEILCCGLGFINTIKELGSFKTLILEKPTLNVEEI